MTREELLDRYGDECANTDEPNICGRCEQFYPCPYKGHGEIGWCRRWGEWARYDDEGDECE